MCKRFFLISLFFTCAFFSAQIKPLVIEKLAPKLYLYQSFNSFKGVDYSANAMFLTTDKGIVLFDVPWQKSQYQELLDIFKEQFHLPLIAVFVTHSHEDRAGDLSFYNNRNIATYATKETNALLKEAGKVMATKEIAIGKTYTFGNHSFIPEYFGKGHTTDNIVIWFPEDKILDGGCLVKSVSANDLGNLEDADVKAWPKTIQKLIKKYPQPVMVIPGHDEWKKQGHLQHTLELLKNEHQ